MSGPLTTSDRPPRGYLRPALALLLTAVTLYLALRDVDPAAVQQALSAARVGPALGGMLAVLIGVAFKIVRWQLLLDHAGVFARPLPVAASFLSGQLLNFVYPFRAGEISRVAVIGAPATDAPASGAPASARPPSDYAAVLGTLAVEKGLDLAAFLLLVLAQLAIRPPGDLLPALNRSLMVSGSLLALALLAGAFFLFGSQRITPAAGRLALHWHRLLAGLEALRSPASFWTLGGLTVLIWAAALLTNWLALRSLGLDLPSDAALLTLLSVQIGISAPSLPAKIGVFEYACILALQAYGVAPETGLSYGILLHIVAYLPVILSGAPALWLAAAQTRLGSSTEVRRHG